MSKINIKICFLFLISFFLQPIVVNAETVIKGIVRDSSLNETLPNVSVYLKSTKEGTFTDSYGAFSITVSKPGTLVLSMIGFEDYSIPVNIDGKVHTYRIFMSPKSYALNEVVVKPKRERYSRRNNPAVDFVKGMIEHKDASDPRNKSYFNYEHYQKISYAWSEFEEGKYGVLNNKFGFLYDHIDTLENGKTILPLGLRETVEDVHYRKDPKVEKKVVKASKQNGLDEILPQEGVQTSLNELFQEVNIFDNDIVLLTNHFPSPFSNIAPTFYKYYLMDTLEIDGIKCVNLGFTPFNGESNGFTGNVYVTADSSMFIKHVRMCLPKDINLNFIKGMTIEQDFERLPDGTRLITKDYMTAEFFVPALPKIYGERLNTYRNYSFSPPEDTTVYSVAAPTIEMAEANTRNTEYWDTLRHAPLSGNEVRTESMMKELRNVPIYRASESIMKVCVNNFIPTRKYHSQFDYGPVFSTISSNDLEGFRIRVGGETTTYFDKHFFLSGYLAYGFKDTKIKGRGSLEWSLNNKKKYHVEFPVHSIKAYFQYDVDKIGQNFIYAGGDDILTSLLRRTDDRNAIYQKDAGFVYTREYHSGISYELSCHYETSYSTWLTNFQAYEKNGALKDVEDFSMSTAKLSIRYAPHEKFYQSRQYRYSLNKEHPVFMLSHSIGHKGILGADYSVNTTEASFKKRFWLSFFGYVDMFIKGVKVWDRVPYPMLDIPTISYSYVIRSEAFSLMDPVEFINDQSVTWELSYFMNGLILNRIPVIRKLQLREVLTFKGLWGSLSDENNPSKDNNQGLFAFPTSTYVMNGKPYMEVGVGVENIFKLFRLDYVWRLNYRDHPDVDKSGLRFAIHLNF